jgi:hypothetical protein
MQMAVPPAHSRTETHDQLASWPLTDPTAHFAVPGRSHRLDPAEPCPAYPPLELEGVAVDVDGGVYLVLAIHGVRSWLGPTRLEVSRKAQLIAGALADGVRRARPGVAWQYVVDWLTDAWEVATSPAHPEPDLLSAEEVVWISDLQSRRPAQTNEPRERA